MSVCVNKKFYFEAAYSPAIAHLNPSLIPLATRITNFIKAIVFFIPNHLIEPLIRLCVLPTSHLFFKIAVWMYKRKTAIDLHHFDTKQEPTLKYYNYTSQPFEILTPDKVKLQGHLLKHPQHNASNARTMILFHGNGDFYQSSTAYWLRELLAQDTKIPYNFVLFNPRGIGNSSWGTPNENTLRIDAESAYQLVKEQLKVAEDRIDLYGHSLGGAQAANLKALHPKTGGRLFLDRTFSSLDTMVSHVFKKAHSRIRNIACSLVKRYGWEMDNVKTLASIQDDVHILSHKHDSVILTKCSLSQAILDGKIQRHEAATTPFYCHEWSHLCSENPHMAPLIKNLYTPGASLQEDPIFKIFQKKAVLRKAA